MWQKGHCLCKPPRDVNAEFLAIDRDLEYEEAQAMLAEFLFHNPAFMLDLLAGIKMYPLQELMVKGWMQNDFNMAVWGRGLSKSWSVSIFVILWALFNPATRITVVSFSFRQSRSILDQCVKFIQEKGAARLAVSFPLDGKKGYGFRRATDEWVWKLPNGSVIKCLPLGDGSKIRGQRADCLIVDEFAFLPEPVVGTILQPFLVAKSNITEQQAIREIEDARIAAGEMKEEDRTILTDVKKVIFLSSACYQFEHMYKRYEEWIKEIMNDGSDPERPRAGKSYFVSRLSYEIAPPGLVDMGIIEDAKKTTSEAVFDREYRAIFTPDSGGYFRASKMKDCTIEDGQEPTMELRGEKGAEYVVAIDTALSGAEDSDHFAIQVLKIVQRGSDGKLVPMLVHSYAIAGGDLKDHITYFYYILRSFNVVYIATDASQGDNVEFLNSCAQSKTFKDAKIDLLDLEADFKTDDFTNVPLEVRRSYNRSSGQIVHKQPFSSKWQRAANEYLQACFDHRGIYFAGKITANSAASARETGANMSILTGDGVTSGHSDFKDMSVLQFMELQGRLVDLTKKECSMIVVKTTELGTLQFGLPQSAKRTTGPLRERKDSYSALLLGVWAFKVYMEILYDDVQTSMPDFPYARIG